MPFAITLPGLPVFNADDPANVVERFESWEAGPAPQAVLVGNGGGPGAVAAGEWLPSESYYVLAGSIEADAAEHRALSALLKAAVTMDAEAPVIVEDPSGESLQVFVRIYDRRTIESLGDVLTFSLPLVSPDPYRYALEPLVGTVGVFTGQRWFRTYVDDGTGRWVRTYTDNAGTWSREYEQTTPDGPYPLAITLDSDGDAISQRVTVEVVGPLTGGDWWIENLLTGRRMWAELSVAAGQTLVFDCRAMTAHLNGADVTHLVFGEWLTLAPGANTYRLNAGIDSDAFATITALPAHQ